MNIAESELVEFKPSDNVSYDLILEEHNKLILLIKDKMNK
jgi:hypothetical protein